MIKLALDQSWEIPEIEQLGVSDDCFIDSTSSYEERDLLAGTALIIFIAIAPRDIATAAWHHSGSEVEVNL